MMDRFMGEEDTGNNAAAMIERERSIAESGARLMSERNVTRKKRYKRFGAGRRVHAFRS
jgi:hypothetical protein